jgi:hypothetical protein
MRAFIKNSNHILTELKMDHIKPISRIEVANININSTSKNEFSFGQNNENIESKFVNSVRCYDITSSGITKSTDNNAVINQAAFKKGFLVLKIDGEDKVNKIPLIELNPQYNGGKKAHFDNLKISLSQSKVVFPDNSSLALSEDLVVVFELSDNK